MARRSMINGVQGATPARTDNKAGPPSTIAAQLVEQHSHAAVQHQPQSRAAFSQLLLELRECPTAIEADVVSNYKLISVVAEAGLDVLVRGNPFSGPSVGDVTEANACLDVIEIAVQRSPEVLFYIGPGTDGPGAEICLWLLPKLFQLMNQRIDPPLQDRLHRLPGTFVAALNKSINHRKELDTLIQLYQIVSDVRQNINIVIPSSEAQSLVYKGGQQPIALRQSYQVQILQTRHALAVALASVTGVSSALENTSSDGTFHVAHGQELQAWALTTFSRIQHSLHKHDGRVMHHQYAELSTALLRSLCNFAKCIEKTNTSLVVRQKVASLLIISAACALVLSSHLVETDYQEQVAIVLKLILCLGSTSGSIMEEARGRLLPILSEQMKTLSELPNLLPEFQRVIETALSTLSVTSLVSRTNQHLLYPHPHTVNTLETLLPGERRNVHYSAALPCRPRKRQKRDSTGTEALPSFPWPSKIELLHEFCSLLRDWNKDDLSGLATTIEGLVIDLPKEKKHRVLDLLAQLLCAGASNTPRVGDTDSNTRVCDACYSKLPRDASALLDTWDVTYWSWFYDILAALAQSPALQSSIDHRIGVMIALRRYSSHTSLSETLDLAVAEIGKWCLQSIRSSSRELRLAAGHTLPNFLQAGNAMDPGICRRNRVLALDYLRQLSDTHDHHLTETLIMTLGQVARVCDHDETNIILLRLVEYLGHTNPLICGLAHLELRSLAQAASTSVEDMFRPYWHTIGITVVKDLLNRPQTSQQLSDLLGMSVNQLLLLTQAETLPYLVLWRKRDILQRIASARGDETTIWDACMHRRNLPAILSLLIVQEPAQLERTILNLLCHASPQFRDVDISNLLKSEVLPIACELLKTAGDESGDNRARVFEGFRQFTSVVERRGSQAKSTSGKSQLIASFFEAHALGMMASFSDTIDNPNEALMEKRRCLRAVEQMIEVARENIRIALPQVRACLHSALEVPALKDQAFVSWAALLAVVDLDEDLEILVDQTVTAIVQNWEGFAESTQKCAYDAVAALFQNHGTLLQGMVHLIPSLSSIHLMSKFESELVRHKSGMETSQLLSAFSVRCRNENAAVVMQALHELLPYLQQVQNWIHESAVTEQPHSSITDLVRSLLDACVRFHENHEEILDLCSNCLGIVGCLDPSRIEATKEAYEKIVMISNFDQANEAVEFVTYLLENVLVNAFHSVSNPRAQGFLAYVMQELLRFCGFTRELGLAHLPRGSQSDDVYQRWKVMSDTVRSTLTPFLSSKYVLKTLSDRTQSTHSYPIFTPRINHGAWLRTFVFDLLQRPNGDNAKMIFTVLSRIIRGYDVSIASFLLPFAAANIILGGIDTEVADVANELLLVMECPTRSLSQFDLVNLKLCSENVFQILDYLSKWLQEKKKLLAAAKNLATKSGREMTQVEEMMAAGQIKSVERVLEIVPADVISRRAVECGSYARALFHWEQYIRQQREVAGYQSDIAREERLYQRLQDIYNQIDEPDGISGISTFLHVLSPDQEIIEHRNAGRWAAAQTWYEIRTNEEPQNLDLQIELLKCLRQAGQHGMVLERAKNLGASAYSDERVLSMVSEAAWTTERWEDLREFLSVVTASTSSDFNVGVGTALLALRNRDVEHFDAVLRKLRVTIAKTLSASTTASLHTCHDQMLKLHALCEVDMLSGIHVQDVLESTRTQSTTQLERRFNLLGSSSPDKQYLLSVRRAVMRSSFVDFKNQDIADLWMQTSKLARKGTNMSTAYHAVLQARHLGEESALIEQARLLWKEGNHRKAIQSLEGAIVSDALNLRSKTIIVDMSSISTSMSTAGRGSKAEHNPLLAKAQLLLAKWLDKAGQTQMSLLNKKYQDVVHSFSRWEKGLYQLGKFYNKLLESEKALPIAKQNLIFLSGETAKLVVENYLRSMLFGCKYLFETVPKLLTLWLDFGAEAGRSISRDVPDEFRKRATDNRPNILATINKQVRKYADRLPAYIYYNALAQMITRISHPNQKVQEILALLIIKVVTAYPQQGLWPLLAIVRSSAADRANRGAALLNKLKEKSKNIRNDGQSLELRSLVNQGQKLSEQLLRTCEINLEGRSSGIMSLKKDFAFDVKVVPCPLVIPLRKTLTASLPTTTDIRNHKAFPATRDAITFNSFYDDVLVLNSLQRPRKLTVRGSDGNNYGLLCKPKDDLRKDQRLMEFNAMINRALKKDAESSKRRLHFRTYAVTPLNEAHGLIEWVEGLKPMRDIMVSLYRNKSVKVDYGLMRELLEEASTSVDGYKVFTNTILPMYRPILHEWFTDLFPDPESWFAARLHYTRSCAVTSMLGYALGLGDRHGENVLLVEKDGGVFHVDFNCLFEKGLTFDKPEMVPFRLTHNMVDAFGAYGVEGPFRRSAECAMNVMRGNEDTLLTILETFVYDPTTDFVGAPRKKVVKGVPETPKEVLNSVRDKVRGLMKGESVPLSVEGHVDALIRLATDPANLCAMYVGWCAFL